MPSVVLYFHTLHHLYDNLVRARAAPSSHSAASAERPPMSFYDVWTTLISPSCPVVFYFFFWVFSVFLFHFNHRQIFPVSPQQPRLFISSPHNSSPSSFFFWCSNLWCCLATGAAVTVWSLRSHFFFFPFFFFPLLFFISTVLLHRCRLSSQIWANTNATRSVWVCTTLWGRVPAARHRKCLSERRVCVFVCLPFYLAVEQMERIYKNWFTLCSLPVPTSPPQNVVVQSSTATQLDVTWDPPPLDAQNGDIQGYKV